jgi:hypothetical protein
MMLSIARRFVACVFVAVAALVVSPARAQNYGDIWWVPSEAGWGLQIAHQGNILFLTWYIFKTDRTPVWVTAALIQQGSSSTFAGDLIATTGPYYGSPTWAPPAVNRVAGSATFTATSITTGTLTYTIDGVTVTKTIQRYAFNFFNLSGTYIGSFLAVQHNCANPLANGPFTGSGQFTITHAPSQQVTIVANLSDNLHTFTCTYTGTYGQDGRLGNISNGSYTCTDGHAGAFSATEIELASQGGILGRYSGTNVAQGCQLTGGFGGLKP